MPDITTMFIVATGVLTAVCVALCITQKKQARILKKLSQWRTRLPLVGKTCPQPGSYIYLKPVVLMAHRGLARYATENTGPAAQLAVLAGANGIEVDLRFTKDNVPVVFHDERLDRFTFQRLRVDSLTWAELSSVHIFPANRILSLDAFLDQFSREFDWIMLDLKDFRLERFNRTRLDAVAQCIGDRGIIDKTIVDTSSLEAVQYLVGLGLAASLREPISERRKSAVTQTAESQHTSNRMTHRNDNLRGAPEIRELAEMGIGYVSMAGAGMRAIHKRGGWGELKVIAICPSELSQVMWCIEHGAFAVITDVVEETLEAMVERGYIKPV